MQRQGSTQPVGAAPQLPRAPALDGVRAMAVLVIMAYHTGFSWVPGGFYGVDDFFVLSGFLITSLLIVEQHGSGTIRLGRFWARRARRLLPALFFMIAVVALVLAVFPSLLAWPDPVPDTLSTLFYVANWHFVGANAGYFAASAAPSPLLHTWSLAIEEQFYLVWPLVVFAVLCGVGRAARARGGSRDGRRRRLVVLGVISATGALASAGWMWWLSAHGADVNRLYYGTDTRAQALLVGATAAVVLMLFRSRPTAVRRGGAVLALGGLAATVAVWHLIPETSTLAFQGGFMLASLAAVAVVVGVVLAPGGPAARLLALPPVRYVGRISYAAYLWYWPVFLVLSTQRLQLGTWGLFACRVAVTLAVAAVSTRFIERPVRQGRLPGWRALVAAPVAAGAALALVVAATVAQPPAFGATPTHAGSGTTVASGSDSVRVLLVGDSMAGSLGVTLARYAPRYGIQLINEGHPGCSLSTDATFQFVAFHTKPGHPCQMGNQNALLDAWRHYVDEYRPDVVLYLARSDMFNQVHDGVWTSIGNPTFDRYLTSQLRKGLAVLTSKGARMVFTTSPYYNAPDPVLADLPENTPHRVVEYDRILRKVSASRPGDTVYPLAAVVDPGHTYQGTVDGVSMRCADYTHFSVDAGKVIAPKLLPVLGRLGRSAHVTPPVHPPPDPPAVPSWYGELQCGQGGQG